MQSLEIFLTFYHYWDGEKLLNVEEYCFQTQNDTIMHGVAMAYNFLFGWLGTESETPSIEQTQLIYMIHKTCIYICIW